ncbi:chromate efflux transporter [Coraliomargarita parva]|uniref:chromate efflux transporter n=1 Tax=Coraliomargarita parva TaxID=3014050 RepID=UPI0022B38F9C|nr:chromate efflux transporter [Coraliomargarita parva]
MGHTESLLQIFWIYFRLGCICFGGPVAHLGYYKEEFINRRQWLSESRFAELLNLCQFIPGPSSSQLGFCVGWHRAGLAGACVAWLGFTLPSVLLMIGFAYGLQAFEAEAEPVIRGLLVAAVAVVGKAVLDLGRKLCPDPGRVLLATVCATAIVLLPGIYMQIASILCGGLFGNLFYRKTIADGHFEPVQAKGSHRFALTALSIFAGLLLLSLLTPPAAPGGLYALHYRAGALVFGGGHVVLPLLSDSVVGGGLLSNANFLAGYSAAQAVPGPLFTFSAFIGTAASPFHPHWLSGLLAVLAIFLPGILLVLALVPYWDRIRHRLWARAGLLGANAAVVGLLLAAFINPVFRHGIHNWIDACLAALAFVGLYKLKLPPWSIVLGCGLVGSLIY